MNLSRHSILRALAVGVFFCLAISGVRADVFVAHYGGSNILRYDDSGAFLGKVRATGGYPLGLTFGPDGGLYTIPQFGNRVSRFDPVTGELAPFTSGGAVSNPNQIVFGGPDNDLYVADHSNSAIWRFDGETGAVEQRIEGVGPLTIGLAVDAIGTVYASTRSGVIHKYSGGALSTFATISTGYFEGLTIGPDGNLYAATVGAVGQVLRYKPDGTPFGVGGSTTDPTFISHSRSTPFYSVNFGPDGSLYVAAPHDHEILRYAADGTFMDTFIESGHGLFHPTFFAFGSLATIPIPEPTTLMLFALGLVLVGSSLRRQGRQPLAETRAG